MNTTGGEPDAATLWVASDQAESCGAHMAATQLRALATLLETPHGDGLVEQGRVLMLQMIGVLQEFFNENDGQHGLIELGQSYITAGIPRLIELARAGLRAESCYLFMQPSGFCVVVAKEGDTFYFRKERVGVRESAVAKDIRVVPLRPGVAFQIRGKVVVPAEEA
jgi:hypothetical protein